MNKGIVMKKTVLTIAITLLATAVWVMPTAAQTVGMVADFATGSVIVFDAQADTVLGAVPFGPGSIGDCAITFDESLGFVTDFGRRVWVIDLTTSPPSLAAGTNPIPISNQGEDLSFIRDHKLIDQRYLVVCDGSNAQPVSVIDIAARAEISTFSLASDCNSVEVLSDGSVLVTSANTGNVHRLTLDSNGNLTDTGEVLNSGGQPNNVFGISRGQGSGIVVRRFGAEIRSFTIPGLALVDTRSLSGFGISGLVHRPSGRAYVRTNGGAVDVFGYNPATAQLSDTTLFTIPIASTPTLFGMDQMAIAGTKLYVSQPGAVNVYDANTGTLLTSITDPSIVTPTGVAFAGDHDRLKKSISQVAGNVPEDYALAQNYPNPFNPETNIHFQLPTASHVVIRIFNTLGQEIRTLVDSPYAAGFHSLRWDAKDKNGNAVSSGIYLYQLKAGAFSQIKKMSLIR